MCIYRQIYELYFMSLFPIKGTPLSEIDTLSVLHLCVIIIIIINYYYSYLCCYTGLCCNKLLFI